MPVSHAPTSASPHPQVPIAMHAPKQTLEDWLREAPFTLTLSAGFFGFFAHAGMVAALDERDIAPARLTGSSAGAMVAGAWASGVGGAALGETLFEITRDDFWDPGVGFGLLRGRRFRTLLENTLGCASFDECRAPVALSAWRIRTRETEVFADGDLASAIHASCCFPGLLQPVRRAGGLYLDGGIADRPALSGVTPGDRVLYHHLSSKSPWRVKLEAPEVPGMTTLAIAGLPRLSPFDLSAGTAAFERAFRATQIALDSPIEPRMNLDGTA